MSDEAEKALREWHQAAIEFQEIQARKACIERKLLTLRSLQAVEDIDAKDFYGVGFDMPPSPSMLTYPGGEE